MQNEVSLRDYAAAEIQSRIQRGFYPPDAILTEAGVCEQLRISRTPAREALISLVVSGVLAKVPRKGYRILENEVKDKLDVFAVWGVLDTLAAQLACPRLTDTDILRMREAVDMADVAIRYRNYSAYFEAQEQFHKVYRDRCENRMLLQLIDQLSARLVRYTFYSEDPAVQFTLCARSNEEHKRMILCFERGDTDGLEAILKTEHWHVADDEMDLI